MSDTNISPQEHNTAGGAPFRASIKVFPIALLALLLAFSVYPGLNLYDDGIIVVGAEEILRGKVPYRDFWTMYAPGQFYLTALLFRIFGAQFFVACLIGVVSKALIVTLSYAAMKRHIRAKWLPAAGAALLALVLARLGNETFPVFPATAFALLALLCMEPGLLQRRLPLLFSAGLCTALTACFRHDLGLYTVVALSLGTILVLLTQCGGSRAIFRSLAVYWGGILAIGAPVAAFFLWKVPPQDLYENLVHIPMAIYPGVRRLPWVGLARVQKMLKDMGATELPFYPFVAGLRTFVVYVPFLIALPSLCVAARKLWRSRKGAEPADASLPFMLLASLLCLLMALKGAVRPEPHHLAQSIVLAVPIGLMLLPHIQQAKPVGKVILICCLALACVPLAGAGSVGYMHMTDGLRNLGAPNNIAERCTHPALPRLRCAMAYQPDDRRNVMIASFLQQRTQPGDPIFVGTGRHDKIYWNAVMLYFMADRPPATRWYELHPGVQTRAETQLEMIEEMRRTPPRVLVLDTAWDLAYENNLSSQPSHISLLDNWLGECYEEKTRFESIHLLAPRTEAGERCGAVAALAAVPAAAAAPASAETPADDVPEEAP